MPRDVAPLLETQAFETAATGLQTERSAGYVAVKGERPAVVDRDRKVRRSARRAQPLLVE